MNSVFVILIALFAFSIGYQFYAKKISDIFAIDRSRETPAVTKCDGIDYVPSKNWLVLFGHHFASIAGAGPIIGPAIAVCCWGWGPSLLWIILGSIFFGGIHDFGALIVSVREGGVSIGDVAESSISQKAKLIFSIFILLALLLVIAVFAYFGADTFVKQPEVIIPSLGIIPVSLLVGLALYKFKLNASGTTLAGLAALGLLIVAGKYFPVTLGKNSQAIWMGILFIYCFIASTLPVNILLQPRDYLSSYLLFGGIALALLGIFIVHPNMNTPAFVGNKCSLGFLWPMMFITIACGANSGFHSVVASGTTSKQIASEGYAKRIGFGGMLLEGLLATIVIVLIVGGFSREEFNAHVLMKTSPVQMFGIGFGNMTRSFLGQWGSFIALTILNAFILTTLDSATRITRYIAEELLKIKNRYLSTGLILLGGAWLAFGKDSANNPLWKTIWPAFGASNQLVAALALLVISCWLLQKNKPTRFSLIPAFFMLVTSLSALVINLIQYLQNKNFALIIVSLLLIGSALFLAKEVFITFRKVSRNA